MSDTQSSPTPAPAEATEPTAPAAAAPTATEPVPSYVKLAMRNMVKKGGKSLFHFTLTTVALLSILVGLAYITR